MERKKTYIAPELTIVQIKAERGYASSSNGVQESVDNFNIFENEQIENDQATTFFERNWEW
jgi:hypothetical protein